MATRLASTQWSSAFAGTIAHAELCQQVVQLVLSLGVGVADSSLPMRFEPLVEQTVDAGIAKDAGHNGLADRLNAFAAQAPLSSGQMLKQLI